MPAWEAEIDAAIRLGRLEPGEGAAKLRSIVIHAQATGAPQLERLALKALIITLARTGVTEEQRSLAHRLVSLDPTDARSYLRLGRICEGLADVAGAEAAYLKGLEISDDVATTDLLGRRLSQIAARR